MSGMSEGNIAEEGTNVLARTVRQGFLGAKERIGKGKISGEFIAHRQLI